MKDAIDVIEYKGYNINIIPDSDNYLDFEVDHIYKIICFHSRYQIGDKHNYKDNDDFIESLARDNYEYDLDERLEKLSYEDGRKLIEKIIDKYYIMLPIYIYDHSGVTINTTGFSCPWDSGQIGWIYIDKEGAKKEFGWKRINTKKVIEYLNKSVKYYDSYLRGEVYGYVIRNKDDNFVEDLIDDSVWGYIGDPKESGLIEDAKAIIDWFESIPKKESLFDKISRVLTDYENKEENSNINWEGDFYNLLLEVKKELTNRKD